MQQVEVKGKMLVSCGFYGPIFFEDYI
jgi:hypothetical protein